MQFESAKTVCPGEHSSTRHTTLSEDKRRARHLPGCNSETHLKRTHKRAVPLCTPTKTTYCNGFRVYPFWWRSLHRPSALSRLVFFRTLLEFFSHAPSTRTPHSTSYESCIRILPWSFDLAFLLSDYTTSSLLDDSKCDFPPYDLRRFVLHAVPLERGLSTFLKSEDICG